MFCTKYVPDAQEGGALATPLKASNSGHHQKTEALWELILRMVFISLQDAGSRERTLGATEKHEVRVTPVLGPRCTTEDLTHT